MGDTKRKGEEFREGHGCLSWFLAMGALGIFISLDPGIYEGPVGWLMIGAAAWLLWWLFWPSD